MTARCRTVAACAVVLLGTVAVARGAQESAGTAPARVVAQTKPSADPVPQLEQALAKSPDDPKANVALGIAYLESGQQARALERMRHAVKVAPNSAEAHNWLGVVLLDRSDFPQGIASG